MNLLDWFLSFFKGNQHYTGVNEDDRPEELKQKDWAHEERELAAVPADPFGNPQIAQSLFNYENQFGTSSCCPHGVGLGLAIERKADVGEYQRLAWIFDYRQRSNYPDAGCYLQNVFEIYRVFGAPLFTTLPTPQTEAQANAIALTPQQYNEAAIFKGFSYFTVKTGFNDIQTIAEIAQKGHGVAILIYATYDEWAREFPTILKPNLTSSQAEVVHCICILPYSGFTKDGKRYVTVQDSAWFGGWKLRHLSEDWIKARVYAAGYWDKVVPLSTGVRPKYNFTRNLVYGATGADVKAMQQLFIAEGLLPSDMATGAFYGRTLAALHAFQAKYAGDILTPNGLNAPTDMFGPASRSKANALCA